MTKYFCDHCGIELTAWNGDHPRKIDDHFMEDGTRFNIHTDNCLCIDCWYKLLKALVRGL